MKTMSHQETRADSQHAQPVDPACCVAADTARHLSKGSLWGRALMAIGVSGATLAALCCVAPFLLAGVLATVGLSFLLKDIVLIPLLMVSLGVIAVGYYMSKRH